MPQRPGPSRYSVFVLCAALAAAVGYGIGRLQLTLGAEEKAVEQTAGAGPDLPSDGPGPFYVEVGQLMVPVLVEGRTNAFILTQITLQTGSVEQSNLLRRHLPHARNALLQALFGMAGAGAFDGPSVDPAAVAKSLKQAAAEQLGPDLVRGVLIDRLMRQENTRL
ncbi:flagellar basal body-associated FliL family protein [Azospirillum brasilense]|uniref:flagellar basal body-associated FliL family protein n=1 Tax=Azospirillum brasilense TaxID=192 RepID=UPI000E0BC04C|nr:flagellar basal body-associated FliL family protein [Azospirillum brasilense]